jgi:hypothetical protein
MKRALCVGINDYPVRGADLKGCVNDARAWAELLRDHYGFAEPDITILLDQQATKANILAALDGLLAGAKRGDVIVFTNSSHGTYVADEDGDETRYDEAMCPWDMKDNLIVDDELRTRFAGLPAGVRLTIISDSCFSGTVTRGPAIATPDDRHARFVNPVLIGRREIRNVRAVAKPVRSELYPESEMKEVLVSGCNDHQYSYDARFDTRYHGAMTYFALDIIREADYRLTYNALRRKLVARLENEGFDQEPQLEGASASRRRRLFS